MRNYRMTFIMQDFPEKRTDSDYVSTKFFWISCQNNRPIAYSGTKNKGEANKCFCVGYTYWNKRNIINLYQIRIKIIMKPVRDNSL
jgi:hypothetical protein